MYTIEILDDIGKVRGVAFSYDLNHPQLLENSNWKFRQKGLKSVEGFFLFQIQKIADEKWVGRKKILLQEKGTDEQIEMYRMMKEDALKGLFSVEENALILEKATALEDAERIFRNMIQTVRKYLSNLVETGQFEKAQQQLKLAEDMGADVTSEDIANFIKV